jgi:hypothetical protein
VSARATTARRLRAGQRGDVVALLRACAGGASKDAVKSTGTAKAIHQTVARFLGIAARLVEMTGDDG